MTYAPLKNGQIDGSPGASKNCVAAVTVMLIDRATVGAKRPKTAQIRTASGAPLTRGLYIHEAVAAAKKVSGVTLATSLHTPRATVRDIVAGGSAVGVTIHTKVTRYTSRKTNYYVGPHEVYVNETNWWPKTGEVCACEKHTTAAHREYTVEDPGTTAAGYLQWSADLLYRAGEALTGYADKINLLVAPDTEGVSRVAIEAGIVRSKPSATAAKLGSIVLNKSYSVIETVNGGGWQRADGTTGNGWHRVKRLVGSGFIRGEALK